MSGFNAAGDTITLQVAGHYYMNTGYIHTGARSSFYFYINGSAVSNGSLFLQDPPSGIYGQMTGSMTYYLNAGDTISVYINGGTFYGSDHNWFTGFHLGF